MSSRTATEGQPDLDRQVRGLITAVAVVAIAWAAAQAIPQPDVRLYGRYAHEMLRGSLSAGLPREYPALAGILFVAVALLPLAYLPAFMATMTAALLALVAAGENLLHRPGWSQRLLLYVVLGAAPLMLARYDLLPALCLVVGVATAMRGRFGMAWVAITVGAALKLFPALLFPVLFIEEWRRTGKPPWRRVAVLAGVAVAAVAAQSALAPGTLLSPVRYEMRRGFEFSSVPATLTLLIDPLHLSWHAAFGAWQIDGVGQGLIGLAMTVAELALLAAAWMWQFRGRMSVEAASLAVISVAMLTDRALAPQYLIWVAPLWALWPLRKSWVAASFLSFLAYPIAFSMGPVGPGQHARDLILATVTAAGRNACLLVGTAVWARSELAGTAKVGRTLGKRCLDQGGPYCYDAVRKVKGAYR